MTVFLWLLGALGFFLVLMLSIALHELGHLYAAKKFNLRVPEYFVGFGKTLFAKERNGTKYGVKAIPLGGYVRILDPQSDDPESAESQLLSHVSPWKRIIVFLAGPMVNIVIGTVLFFLLFSTANVAIPTNTIEKITCSQETVCAAQDSGLQTGDKILSIEGTPVTKGVPAGLVDELMKTHTSLTMVIERDGEEKSLNVTPTKTEQGYLFGIQFDSEIAHLTFAQSMKATGMIYENSVMGVLKMPTKVSELWRVVNGGERTDETPVSVVGVTRASGDITASHTLASEDKQFRFLSLVASFNLGIGLINLLPLLPLDGGRILVAIMDSVKRRFATMRKQEFKPVGMKFMNAFTMIVLVCLIMYMGLAITADIVNPMKIE